MLIALALLAAGQPQTNPLAWMVGSWCTDPVNGAQSCETWSPADKGVMQGEGKTRSERGTTGEAMRILFNESGIWFHAEPQGQAPTDFRAVKIDSKARAVTFEDKTHDYPQRVRYWREGELLMAEIAMADGSKPRRWSFKRAK